MLVQISKPYNGILLVIREWHVPAQKGIGAYHPLTSLSASYL